VPYFCTVLTESDGNGFSQPIASSPIGSVNSASISVRWRRNTTADLGMGWPHAGSAATRSRRAGRSRRIDASEGEFCAVVGQPVSPDRVDMVAPLRGELNPDAWPVDAHVVAPIAQVRRAGVGHLDLIEFSLVELAVFSALRAITRPGRDRF